MRKSTCVSVVWAVIGAALVLAGPSLAAQQQLVHTNSIDLGDVFNDGSGNGNNPLSLAFDGTNAYVGGFNNTAAASNVAVVRVDNVVGPGVLAKTPLAPTQFSSPAGRGIDSLAYSGGALVVHHDSGSAGFISRHNAADGSSAWSINSPQGARPLGAVGIDPIGDGGSPGVAYLVQGSGRRRLLSLTDGSTIFDGTNGGIVNSVPTFFGTAWRGVAFDSVGNIALTEDSGFQYGARIGTNQWQALNGTSDRTSSSITRNNVINNVGQGIAILEGLGSDLLAVSARSATQFTDLAGAATAVSDTMVHLRNLDGSTTGLTQLSLTGDENGVGTPWTGNVKNLAFGIDASNGMATLLVLDFSGRRLDIYQVPEPASLLMIAAAVAPMLVRRRRRRAD